MKYKRSDARQVMVKIDRYRTETTKAVLFSIGGKDVWLPFSQITECAKNWKSVAMPLWLAVAKDLGPYLQDERKT